MTTTLRLPTKQRWFPSRRQRNHPNRSQQPSPRTPTTDDEADASGEPSDDSGSAAADADDEADASGEPSDDSGSAAADADEAVAAPPPSLADVCPSPIIVQHDWYPDYTHGPMFQLAGPDGEVDGNGYYTNEIEPGVTIQLRPGGPAVGFQPPSSLIYQDPSILIGMVSTDNLLGSSANAPVIGVVSPIAVSPIGLMWPADAYDFETVADIAALRVSWGRGFVSSGVGECVMRSGTGRAAGSCGGWCSRILGV